MLNKVILQGRLTADPELSQTMSGISSCRFSVAVDRGYKSANGEKQTDFISCHAWRQTAEFVGKYFSKGKMIIIEGSLQNNNYTDKNNIKHYSYVVKVDNVSFGESKAAEGQASASAPPPAATPPANNTTAAPVAGIGSLDEFEEIINDGEVPF